MKKQLKNAIATVCRYPFSTLCLVLVWALSLTPFFPETPFDTVELADKWTHLVMYGGTAFVMWVEYWRRHAPNTQHLSKLWLWAGIGLSLMGGLLELIQAYLTTTRSGEWLDFVADSIGALGVCLIGTLLSVFFSRRH
jgi:hypothetical protein